MASSVLSIALGWLTVGSNAVLRIPEAVTSCTDAVLYDTIEIASLYYSPAALSAGQRSMVLFNRSGFPFSFSSSDPPQWRRSSISPLSR